MKTIATLIARVCSLLFAISSPPRNFPCRPGLLLLIVVVLGAGPVFGQVSTQAVFVGPTEQNVTVGRNTRFTATGQTGAVQWQVSTNGVAAFTDLVEGGVYTGTKSATLELVGVTAAMGNYQFRVTFTVGNVLLHSNACILTVSPAFFPMPSGIAADSSGNLYVSDEATHTVYRGAIVPANDDDIYATLHLTPLAGNTGQTGSADGTGTGALFNHPAGLASAPAGVVALVDSANGTIRQISAAGAVSTLAGSTASRGNVDGVGAAARFSTPVGIARAPDGSYYVADSNNHTIRKVTADGIVSTFAGSPGNAGSADGIGAAARFNHPEGVAVDGFGTVYVADTTNNLIRKITPLGEVSTLAGIPGVAGAADGGYGVATFNAPGGIAVSLDGRMVFVADTGNSTIRILPQWANYAASVFAGTPTVSGLSDDGFQLLDHPKAIAVSASADYYTIKVYIADTGNAAIRVADWDNGLQTFILDAGTGGPVSPPPVTPPPTVPSTPAPTSSQPASSSGGGAFSGWFIVILAALWLLRMRAMARRPAAG